MKCFNYSQVSDDLVFSKQRINSIHKELRWVHAYPASQGRLELIAVDYGYNPEYEVLAYSVLYSTNNGLYVSLVELSAEDGRSFKVLVRKPFCVNQFIHSLYSFD